MRFTPVKSDLLLRLLIADLVGEEATVAGIAALRDGVADLLERLDDADASAAALPHRRKYLLLGSDFLRRLLDLHLQLVDEVERDFTGAAPTVRERGG